MALRRALLTTAVAAVVALGLTACTEADAPAAETGGAGSPPASADPEPAQSVPVTDATIEQLIEALPSDAELPDGSSVESECPGADDCFEAPGTTQVGGVTLSLDGGSEDLLRTPGIYLNVWKHEDVADAEKYASILSESRADLVGDFDTEAEVEGEGFTPGQRGTGELEDLTVGDWTGFQHSADSVLT